MSTRFELSHSPFARAGATVLLATEFLLSGVLVSYGHVAPESAAAFAGLLMAASFAHAWFVLGARYEVTTSTLRIIHGPWRRAIDLADVLAARPLRTLDRGPVVQLRLAYGRELRLTPRDRVAFLDALGVHVAHLKVDAIEVATRSVG